MTGIGKRLWVRVCLPLFWIGRVSSLCVAVECAAAEQFYHLDPLGSTSVVTGRDGGTTQQTLYSPYGEVLYVLHSRLPDSRFLYTGQELDRESDLSYHDARYYDSILSRFASVDPVEGNLPYTYANNNPVIFTDPDGNNPLLIPVVTGLGFVAFQYGMAKGSGEDIWYTKEEAAADFFTGALMGFGGIGIGGLSTRLGLSGVGEAVFQGMAQYINATTAFAAREVVYKGADPAEAFGQSALWPLNLLLLPAEFISEAGPYVAKYYLEPAGFHAYDPAAEVQTVDELIQKYHTSYLAGRFPFGDLTGRNPLLQRLEQLADFNQNLSHSQKKLESFLGSLQSGDPEDFSREERVVLTEQIQDRLDEIPFWQEQINQDAKKIGDTLWPAP